MTDRQKHQELLEAYLANNLEKEARADFEKQLETNKELAQELALHKELDEALQDQETFDFESTLLEVRSELDEEEEEETDTGSAKVVPFFKKYRGLSIAASILLLIGAFYFLQPSTSSDPFAQFYEPYPNYLTTRSGDPSENELLNNSILQYKNKDFQNALNGFQSLLDANANQYDLIFYKGMCQLELKQSDAAIASLKDVIAEGANQYVQPALWYSALAQVQKEDLAAAKTTLQSIIDQKGDYQEQAKALLNTIK